MEFPIKYSIDPEAIAEEAASFRAMSPDERLQRIREVLCAGALLLQRSPHAAYWRRYLNEQEELGIQRVKDFIARHLKSQVEACDDERTETATGPPNKLTAQG